MRIRNLLGIALSALVALPLPSIAQKLTNRIDNVPMYGQPDLVRDEASRAMDERFIAEAVAGIGSREAASLVWWKQAEEFMSKRNYDLAMRRYNQAWLLNPKNFRPYWGFARNLIENDRPADSALYFDKAVELVDDPHEKPALLTDSASVYTFLARQSRDDVLVKTNFERARTLLSQSIALDPEYGNAYKRLAMLLYYQGDYAGAWSQVKEARKRPDTQIPAGFLQALRKAQPEPQ